MKKILFILSNPPHSGTKLQESLDLIMTAAAFDQKISLLLLDKAVFNLKQGQDLQETSLKDTAAIFNALPLYDVNTIYVESESLSECGLVSSQLTESIIEVKRSKVGQLCGQFDLVLSV